MLMCLHATLQYAEDSHQTHHLAPTLARDQLLASAEQHQCPCSAVAVPAAFHAPCTHTNIAIPVCNLMLNCLCQRLQAEFNPQSLMSVQKCNSMVQAFFSEVFECVL